MVSTLRMRRVYERVRKPIGMIMGGILALAGNQAGDRVKLPSPKAALAMGLHSLGVTLDGVTIVEEMGQRTNLSGPHCVGR